jgi:broad specificity phosphatase PhoE
MEIVFLRHGESTGNASGVIQGRGSSPLSELGRSQAEAAGRRLADDRFDVVVSSDMERAVETAQALGVAFEQDAAWREMDLGAWDGVPLDELAMRFPDDFAALRKGDPIKIGGTGESFPEFTERIERAISALVSRNADRVLVSTHGGVIERAVSIAIGLPASVSFAGRVSNTSLTTVSVDSARMRLDAYNDTGHLGPMAGWAADRLEAGDSVIALIRHGRTAANDTGVWQGHTDNGLDDEGRRQVRRLADWHGGFDTLYASTLGRSIETAAMLRVDGSPVSIPELKELGMGAWEGHTVDEIKAGWPDLWEDIYERGVDERRGGHGETWSGMVERVSNALAGIAREHPGRLVGAVSHGAAIRGFCSSLMGLDHAHRRGLRGPDNASISHVVFGRGGPVLADYNIGPL